MIFTIVIGLILSGLGGMADGLNQTLYAHYDRFKSKFPNTRDQYWNPAISWTNKGSQLLKRTIFVSTTDAYHLTRTITFSCTIAGAYFLTLNFPVFSPTFLRAIAAVGLLWSAKAIGFHSIYTFLFKQKKS